MESKIKELNNIKNKEDFKIAINDIVLNHVNKDDVGMNLINFTVSLDDLCKEIDDNNGLLKDSGIVAFDSKKNLVVTVRNITKNVLRINNALIGYDDLEAFNKRLIDEVSIELLHMHLIDAIDSI